MRSLLLFTVAAPLLAFGCNKSETTSPAPTEKVAADNTGRNQRETATTPTADQAPQSGTDLELTAKIRKRLMSADGLSVNAQNAKIVVDKGVVHLVGPVASDAERTRVASIASDSGAAQVVNDLEITN
ncbi:MAG TPA: BON domain-containing protein [Kofleriaceae bacterium]|jgi:osmotically-inducible protein OsmY